MYDNVLTFSDTEQICKDLLDEIDSLCNGKQWVPIDWVPQINGKTNSAYDTSEVKSTSEPRTIGSSECIRKLANPSPQLDKKKWNSPKLQRKSPKSSPATLRRLTKSSPKSSYKRLVDSPEDGSHSVVTSAEVCHDGEDKISPTNFSTQDQGK